MMKMDLPRVRSNLICPLCGSNKVVGLICCWRCFRERDMRNGNKEAEALIAEAEVMPTPDEYLPATRKE